MNLEQILFFLKKIQVNGVSFTANYIGGGNDETDWYEFMAIAHIHAGSAPKTISLNRRIQTRLDVYQAIEGMIAEYASGYAKMIFNEDNAHLLLEK